MDIRRRHIIIAIVVFAMVAILIKPSILSALFVFIFMGIVPGTNYTLPSWVSLLGLFLALMLSIRWLLYQPTYQPVATTKDRALRHAARRRVLKLTTPRTVAVKRLKKQPVKI